MADVRQEDTVLTRGQAIEGENAVVAGGGEDDIGVGETGFEVWGGEA